MKVAETDVAAAMVAWLESMRWDVYQEVTLQGSIADIVATRDKLVWIIECKAAFGLAVLGQAYEWRARAHFVSVVTPHRRSHTGGRLERAILEHTGIGLHYTSRFDEARVIHEVQPAFSRRAPLAADTRDKLRPEHKTFAPAGNANGSRWTPFQDTCKQLLEHVRRNPGCTLRDAIKGIKHHYVSQPTAVNSLRKWIEKGIVDGVEMRRDGRVLTLHLKRAQLELASARPCA